MNAGTGGVRQTGQTGVLVPQIFPAGQSEEKLDDLELETQALKETVYQSLTAQHRPDYVRKLANTCHSAGGSTHPDPAARMGPW